MGENQKTETSTLPPRRRDVDVTAFSDLLSANPPEWTPEELAKLRALLGDA
jgi:hypothetical protein